MSDPVMFKSIAGVDYIGVIEDEDDFVWNVKEMFAAVPQQDQQTQEIKINFGSAVHPALAKVDSKTHGAMNVPLRKATVLFTYEPNGQLEEAYRQATSGIQIVQRMPGNM